MPDITQRPTCFCAHPKCNLQNIYHSKNVSNKGCREKQKHIYDQYTLSHMGFGLIGQMECIRIITLCVHFLMSLMWLTQNYKITKNNSTFSTSLELPEHRISWYRPVFLQFGKQVSQGKMLWEKQQSPVMTKLLESCFMRSPYIQHQETHGANEFCCYNQIFVTNHVHSIMGTLCILQYHIIIL
jgi:hypothetical protein